MRRPTLATCCLSVALVAAPVHAAAQVDWLQAHQGADGSFSAARFMDRCGEPDCVGAGSAEHDVAATAMMVLAWHACGHGARMGRAMPSVRSAVQWLASVQQADGGFGAPAGRDAYGYDHAVATLALCEAYGLARWDEMRPAAQRAVDWLVARQHGDGHWRLARPVAGLDDTLLTGWSVLALLSAADFGLPVPPQGLERAIAWLARIGAGAPPRDVAVALLCRILAADDHADVAEYAPFAERLLRNPPDPDRVDHAYGFFGSYALYQLGGESWDRWQQAMVAAVVRSQRSGGHLKGTWDPEPDLFAARGGRVHSTALMVLSLAVYYRYDRVLPAR